MPPRAKERICSVEGCDSEVKAKGLCPAHYQMKRKHGRLHRILRNHTGINCEYVGCKKQAEVCGYCRPHYKNARREGLIHQGKYERDHPLYSGWWARRRAGVLDKEWVNDFRRFISDVGSRPGPYFTLARPNETNPLFGPQNWEWREHLRKRPEETKREWYARKWQSRKEAHPGWDNNRSLLRKYGISREQYNAMRDAQNNLCAICLGPEKKIDHRTGGLRSLAVDHCHVTGKVRGLLCSTCNMMMGQIKESLDILRAMEAYMLRHLAAQKK